MAAIRALEARSLEFMREKEEKRYGHPQAAWLSFREFQRMVGMHRPF